MDPGRTQVRGDLVRAPAQLVVVVPAPELGERREAGGAHPVLEVLVLLQVRRRRRVRVSVRVTQGPVRWRCNLVDAVTRRRGVLVRLARPGDAALGPLVDDAAAVGVRRLSEVRVGICDGVL